MNKKCSLENGDLNLIRLEADPYLLNSPLNIKRALKTCSMEGLSKVQPVGY